MDPAGGVCARLIAIAVALLVMQVNDSTHICTKIGDLCALLDVPTIVIFRGGLNVAALRLLVIDRGRGLASLSFQMLVEVAPYLNGRSIFQNVTRIFNW